MQNILQWLDKLWNMEFKCLTFGSHPLGWETFLGGILSFWRYKCVKNTSVLCQSTLLITICWHVSFTMPLFSKICEKFVTSHYLWQLEVRKVKKFTLLPNNGNATNVAECEFIDFWRRTKTYSVIEQGVLSNNNSLISRQKVTCGSFYFLTRIK